MDYVLEWNWATLLLYLILAVVIAYLFKEAINAKKRESYVSIFNFKFSEKYLYYFLIYYIFVSFSAYRTITPNVNGADTMNYVNYFNTLGYVKFFTIDNLIMNSYEYLFYNLMFIVRLLGGNFFNFSFIVYSIIILCYIYVVDNSIENEDECIWLIMVFLPLLKSLNIVRNILAAAIGFVAIVHLNNNDYKKFLIFAIASFLNHYIAVVLLLFGLFVKFVPEKFVIDRKKVLICNILIIVLSYILLPIAKLALVNSGFVGYINKIEVSLWGYLIIYAFYALLLFNKGFVTFIMDRGHFVYYKMMIFLCNILPIFILLNGASRVLLFFDLPRFILYSDLYSYFKQKIPKNYRFLYGAYVCLLIIGYLIFRIMKIWDNYAIMPYYNDLFKID